MSYSKNNETEVLVEEKKFGSPEDIGQYNPNFQRTVDFFRNGIGNTPTGDINEFMSRIAPQIPGFFTNAQQPFMAPLTERAGELGANAASDVAGRYSGINAAYSRAANEDIAHAVSQPFADVQNQLGQQALGMGSQFMGQALGEYGAGSRARIAGLSALSAPQYMNPYTYQGEQRAAVDQGPGFWESAANVATTALPFIL